MSNADRLTGLDASFLHLERDGRAHMHVAELLVFEGRPPGYADLVEHIRSRLDLVPRYRQRLAAIPFGQGRPVWVDDAHFNLRYHVRHTGLPAPGGDTELRRLAGRLFSQPLDRSKPLWELWLVEGLANDRFAIIGKTHHALVDGIAGVDITTVLFDTSPDPPAPRAPSEWVPRPAPSAAELLGQALLERATVPAEIARGVRAGLRTPRRALTRVVERLAELGAFAWAGLEPAPPSPYNVRIGPHRRFEWVEGDLATFRAIKQALDGTVNDAVLTVVAMALGRHLRHHGHDTAELELKALVPVSVRADDERAALGNRVTGVWAPLPVGETDPAAAFDRVHAAMARVKETHEAVGARTITELADFAPPTIVNQAARLQARQRLFNVVVTNVPGPQFPLYLLGRRLRAIYPVVPLAENQAVAFAVLSYDGRLGFGLLADHDRLPDLSALAEMLEASIADLARAAGTRAPPRRRRRRSTNGRPSRELAGR